ncbi:MAG: helix-turn-helix domain-containing protein [Bacillota bacterium]|nr:helix-turn-helix domain-containing protein [Bacillota bacterium]
MEPLLTVGDVAKYLKVTPRTVYSFLESGTLKGVKIGRSWRIRKHDLEMLGGKSIPVYENHRQLSGDAAMDARNRLIAELMDFDEEGLRDLARLISIMKSDRSLRRYKAIFDAMPCATLVVDSAGNVTVANAAAVRLLGMTVADLKTRKIGELPGMEALAEIDNVFDAARREGGSTVLALQGRIGEASAPIQWIQVCLCGQDDAIVQFCCNAHVG